MYEVRCGQLYVKIGAATSPRNAALKALREMEYCKLNHIIEVTHPDDTTSMFPAIDLVSEILSEAEPQLRIHEEGDDA